MGPSALWEMSAKEDGESSGQRGLEFTESLSQVWSWLYCTLASQTSFCL